MVKKKDATIKSSAAEYLTYVSAVGNSVNSIEIRYENETAPEEEINRARIRL